MKTRIISALMALGIFFTILAFGGKWGLYFICYTVTSLAIVEYSNLFSHFSKFLRYSFIALCIFCFSADLILPNNSMVLFSLALITHISLTIFTNLKTVNILSLNNSIIWSLLGFVYLGIFPSFILKMSLNWGGKALVTLMLISFLGDTMALLIGRLWGKSKLSPHISPNKTVQGLIGGVFGGSFIAAGVISYLFTIERDLFLQRPAYMTFSFLAVGLVSQMGDLFESILKRVSGIKDTGSIMPGHGGILDRADGLFFAAPLFYFLFSSIFIK